MDDSLRPEPSPKTVSVAHLSPFDWVGDADELGDNLQAVAHTRLGATSFSSGGAEYASSDYVFSVDGVGLKSHLLLQPGKNELRIAVAGLSGFGEDEVERWTEVVREALNLLGRPRMPWPWAAVIAPAGTSCDPGRCLAGLTTIGGLTLRPTSRAIRRSPRPIPWSPSRPIANAWPAVVEGSGWTYDWQDSRRAQQRARAALHRLCALLTVAFDGVPWMLEWQPGWTPPGYLDVPQQLLDPDAPDIPFGRRPIELPSWIGAAWSALDEDPSLDQALGLYHEGAQLRGAHPSMALVALVGTIESLARTKLERCQSCNQFKDATKRFKAALAEVLTEKEAAELGRLYGTRSKTAHEGKLFGFETTFNAWEHSRFIPHDGRFDFTMRLSYEAQHAGGLLLARRFEEAAGRRHGR